MSDNNTILVRKRRLVVRRKRVDPEAGAESDVMEEMGLKRGARSSAWVRYALLAVVALLACAVYSNATSCEFVFDDEAAVVKNPDVNPVAPLSDLLRHDFWGQDITSNNSHKSFRPLTTLTFKLNRLLSDHDKGPYRGETVTIGGEYIENGYTPTPRGLASSFHAVNVVLHALACVLVYFVATEIFRASEVEAFVGAAIFAVHPVHTEAVTGVVGRADLLSAIFCMLAYLSFARAAGKCATNYLLLGLSSLFVVLATASKENGMTVACVLFVHDLVVSSEIFPSLYKVFKKSVLLGRSVSETSETASITVTKGGKKEECIETVEKTTIEDNVWTHLREITRPQAHAFLVRQFVNVSVLVVLLAYRKYVTVTMASESHFRYMEAPLLLTNGTSYLYSMGRIHTKYMELLVAPIHLSADWSFNQIPLVYDLFSVQNIFTLVNYACLLFAVVSSAWDLERGKYHLISLAWLVATFIPAANIFYVVGTMIGERLLYVPSIGFCLFVGRVFSRTFAKSDIEVRTVMSLFFISVIAWDSVKTYTRNYDWKDQGTLFHATTITAPESAKAQLMYGEYLQEKGKFRESLEYLQRAKEISPEFCDLDNPIGTSLFAIGRVEESLVYMHKALNCPPSTKVVAINLNKIYNERITKNPNDIEAYIGWADVLAHIDRKSDAARYYVNSANIAVESGERALAKSLYEKAVREMPSNCEANFMYGTMLLDDGMIGEAPRYLLAASYAHNCSGTFVYSIGRLNFIYQQVAEGAKEEKEPLVSLGDLRRISERLSAAVEDPEFNKAKEKVLEEAAAAATKDKKMPREAGKKDTLDVSTLGTSDEGYVLVEDDDEDDE